MTTINLTELFEVQRKLDAEIERKHPSVDGGDRLAKRILALQVELGECANEWRGFKFWSNRQTANTLYQTTCDSKVATHYYCETCKKDYDIDHGLSCDGILYPMRAKNPLLEEYVDCLHFILSIGNGMRNLNIERASIEPITYVDVTGQFNEIFGTVHALINYPELYWELFNEFIGLGEMLGFTWEQIEIAYMSKNAINHQRQAEGY